MFLFPNRCARFEFVDNELARVKRTSAMGRCHGHSYCNLTYLQIAYAMHYGDPARAETIDRFCGDAFEFCCGHAFMRFIGKTRNGPFVVSERAHQTGERYNGTARIAAHQLRKRANVDRFAYDGKHSAPAHGWKQRQLVAVMQRLAIHHQTSVTCKTRGFRQLGKAGATMDEYVPHV
jgi:hypothetical protein